MTTATFTAAAVFPRLFDAAGALAALRRWWAQQQPRTVQAAAPADGWARAQARAAASRGWNTADAGHPMACWRSSFGA